MTAGRRNAAACGACGCTLAQARPACRRPRGIAAGRLGHPYLWDASTLQDAIGASPFARLVYPPTARIAPPPYSYRPPSLSPLPPPLIPHTTGVCNARQRQMRCSARGMGGAGFRCTNALAAKRRDGARLEMGGAGFRCTNARRPCRRARSHADPTAGSSNENRRMDLPVLAVVWNQAYAFALKVPVQLVDPSFAVVLVTPAVDAQPERNNAK